MYSFEEIEKYRAKYLPQGIIVDTNIFILFLIGNYDPNFIKDCKALNDSNKKYSIDDFELLKKILKVFNRMVITPQVIAEISNLSITKSGLYGERFLQYLRAVVKILREVEEHYEACKCLWGMEIGVVGRFGFVDMTMFELSKNINMPILTDDLPFFLYCSEKQRPSINFEYIKNLPFQSIFSN